MKAAIVEQVGQAPVYRDFPEPVAADGESLISVIAAALTPLARARASGTHYSFSGALPLVAGVDGTGTTPDGKTVYFVLPRAPYGAMAERTVVSAAQCLALPGDLDPVTAAVIANPGMSSWAALSDRARFVPGETVLINGATGASGRLAVQIARHRGAARVIATGRDRAALESLAANAVVVLDDDPETLVARFVPLFANGVDVVLDYLWGPSARALLLAGARAFAPGRAIRFVQIGTAGGTEIGLPGALLRSSPIELMGSGLGSVAPQRLVALTAELLAAAGTAGFRLPMRTLPLAAITHAWNDHGRERLVFLCGE